MSLPIPRKRPHGSEIKHKLWVTIPEDGPMFGKVGSRSDCRIRQGPHTLKMLSGDDASRPSNDVILSSRSDLP